MGTFKEDTGKTIQDAFNEYHKNNPEILLLIAKEADRAIRAGKTMFSVKQIIGYVRWNVFIETKDAPSLFPKDNQAKSFKINDAYTSRYARLLIEKFPYMKDKIEMRNIRSL